MEPTSPSSEPRPTSSRKKWLHATLIMFGSVGLLGGGCLFLGFSSLRATEPVIESFHRAYNAEDLRSIWNDAHASYRLTMNRDKHDKFLKGVRKLLGKYLSGERMGWHVQQGTNAYVTVSYRSQFESGEAIETFTFLNDGQPKIAGYFVDSPKFRDLVIDKGK